MGKPRLSFLVYKLQQSDKSVLAYNNPTTFVNINGKDILQLSHPQETFALNLRCYLPFCCLPFIVAWTCSSATVMTWLLRYVSSYIRFQKQRWILERQIIFQIDFTIQAAYRHIKEMNVSEPEMWMSMSFIKISWTCSRTKEYCPP